MDNKAELIGLAILKLMEAEPFDNVSVLEISRMHCGDEDPDGNYAPAGYSVELSSIEGPGGKPVRYSDEDSDLLPALNKMLKRLNQ